MQRRRWIHRNNGVYEALVLCRKYYPWRVAGYSRLIEPPRAAPQTIPTPTMHEMDLRAQVVNNQFEQLEEIGVIEKTEEPPHE
jgi:hypothetical protein